jgi:hypothetical protein
MQVRARRNRHSDMRDLRSITLLIVFPIVLAQAAYGQSVIMAPIPEDNSLSPKILGGKQATRSDWPVTLVFPKVKPICTATVVGARAVITAAHCVNDGSPAQVLINNTLVDLTCYRHPNYRACPVVTELADIVPCTADVALCATAPDQVIPMAAGKFERVKRTPPGAASGKKIALLGFGCITPNGKMTTVLQIGQPKVAWTSQPGASHNPQNVLKEFIKTVGPASCDGDSGGAGYSSTDPKSREIIGINSRGNISSESYLVNVLDTLNAKFLTDMSTKKNLKICGLDPDAQNCLF